MSSTFPEPLTHGDTVPGKGQKDMLTAEKKSCESTSATAPGIQSPATCSTSAYYSRTMSKVGCANPRGEPRRTLPGSSQVHGQPSSGRDCEMVVKHDNESASKQHLDGSTGNAQSSRRGKFLDTMQNCGY